MVESSVATDAKTSSNGKSNTLQEVLYVENTKGGNVSVVDLSTFEVIDSFDVDGEPDDVISSSDGKTLFLSVRHYHTEAPNKTPILDPGELIAVSVDKHEVQWRIPIVGKPDHPLLSKEDRYIYQPVSSSNYVEVIDVEKQKSIQKVPVGFGSHGLRLSPDGQRVYVGCQLDRQMTVFDAYSFEVIKTIPFPEQVRPFSLTSDEKRVYVQQSHLHGFYVVDLETDEIIERVDLPALPPGTPEPRDRRTVNHGMNITPDDKILFAAGSAAGYVAVYSLPDHKLITTIPVGAEPNWVIFNKNKDLCIVSNRMDDTVSIISVAELKEIQRVSVGKFPQRMTTVMKQL